MLVLRRRHCIAWRSGGRGPSLKPSQSGEVVGEIGECDLGGCSGQTDGPDDQMEAALLGGEDVLDPCADPGAGRIAAADMGRHRLAARLGALELGLVPAAVEEAQIGLGAICRIGPHAARQVVDVKQASELGAIVGCGMGHREAPHEAVRTVDADMVLVAEHRDQNLARRYPLRSLAGERLVPLAPALQRPAAVTVDLRAARRRLVRWRAAALERLLLRLVQPRPAGLDHRRIDDLATHGKETTLAQRPVKALE